MKLWKDFRTNLMYWRFRNITRNRLRLQSWWARRRQTTRVYRPRGTASIVYRHSARRTWTALLATVVALTALTLASRHLALSPTLAYLLSVCVVIGAIYWTLRGL